jgi:hypothetical protein
VTIQLSPTISLVPVVPAIELQLAGFGSRVINSTFSNNIAGSRGSRWFPGTAGTTGSRGSRPLKGREPGTGNREPGTGTSTL